MVKLTRILKEQTIEVTMVDALNNEMRPSPSRGYNGLSAIGEKCHRKLQLSHYNAISAEHSVRILRLFKFGHQMEPVLIKALKDCLGIEVYNDQEEVIGFAGHWKGHIDGLGRFLKDSKFAHYHNKPFLCEFKTHKASSFADLKKNGVQKSKPMHYSQMTSYAGHLGGIELQLYVAYNKDTSEIYIEWVPFDAPHFEELKRKESEVVLADTLLPRIGNDSPMWFDCKMCDGLEVCFGRTTPNKNCKTCEHVDILDKGVWKCSKGIDADITVGCDQYTLAEILNVD